MARALLLDYLKCDLAGGNKAFIEYSDKQTPLRLAEEFEAILSTSPCFYDYELEFYANFETTQQIAAQLGKAVCGVWIPVGP